MFPMTRTNVNRLAPIVAALLASSPAVAADDTLVTPSFEAAISINCAEGNVTCDDVTYVGTSRTTGKSIKLHGRTLHSLCADGKTPCAFQGYEFRNGKTHYRVLQSGDLLVTRGNAVLVQEHGHWRSQEYKITITGIVSIGTLDSAIGNDDESVGFPTDPREAARIYATCGHGDTCTVSGTAVGSGLDAYLLEVSSVTLVHKAD